MFCTQFLGAFSDNVFKQALILLLTYGGAAAMGYPVSTLNNLAALLFILPFFALSAMAGLVAESMDKARLSVYLKRLELVTVSVASLGFVFDWYWLLFVALFLLGTQSAFFGPAKYAYLPEMIAKEQLLLANGWFQMGTSLSILLGMMFAGILTRLELSAYWLSGALILVSSLGLFCAKRIPATRPNEGIQVRLNPVSTTKDSLTFLYRHQLLWFIVLGNSWFWFFGATVLTQTSELALRVLAADELVVIFLLGLFSVGVSLGSLLCRRLTGGQVNVALLPFGILGLSAGALDLAYNAHVFTPLWRMTTLSRELLSAWRIFLDVFVIGCCGGLYIVPLYAYMQEAAPMGARSRIVGANNVLNAGFMVASAVFALVLLSFGSLALLFAALAFMTLAFGAYVYLSIRHVEKS